MEVIEVEAAVRTAIAEFEIKDLDPTPLERADKLVLPAQSGVFQLTTRLLCKSSGNDCH